MNILIIISFFFSFCTKALDTAQFYLVDQYFIFMLRCWRKKKNEVKKSRNEKKSIIVHLQRFALET